SRSQRAQPLSRLRRTRAAGVVRLKGGELSLPMTPHPADHRPAVIRVLPHIARAIDERAPIVALESSVFAQGLPIPENREAARRLVGGGGAGGAVAGITAIAHGTPTIGLRDDELERFLARDGIRKVSARDIPAAMIRRHDGATTVAASVTLASA